MKIALLSFEYPSETGFGGIGTYTWYQARALAKLGHEVHVLAGAVKPTQLRTLSHDGVTVHRYRARGILMNLFHLLAVPQLWWTKNRIENALCMYRGLKALKRKYKYDIIEMPECGAEGLFINYLFRDLTLIKFHSPSKLIMPYYKLKNADIKLCSFVEQKAINGVNALSSCSQFLANEVKHKLRIGRPIRVIPNGIDLDLFDTSEQINFRRKFKIPENQLVIFFSGRMEFRKGIHLCKEIAASILKRHEVSFVFAGQDLFNYMSDRLLPHLKDMRLKGSIYYLGKLDQTDVRSCLRQSDIFLIPSLWENCPYSCLEAMAAGRAIVSSDQGGMSELIKDGENGLLARSEDPGSYIEGLDRLIEDNSLRDKLGNNARQTVEKSFRDTVIAQMSVNYYSEYMNRET